MMLRSTGPELVYTTGWANSYGGKKHPEGCRIGAQPRKAAGPCPYGGEDPLRAGRLGWLAGSPPPAGRLAVSGKVPVINS